MNATALLNRLRLIGCRVTLDETGRLFVDAPRGAVDPDLLAMVRHQRTTLVDILRAEVRPPLVTLATGTAGRMFAGWVRFVRHGWLKIIDGRLESWVRQDLAEYLTAVGDAAIDSLILPDGQRP